MMIGTSLNLHTYIKIFFSKDSTVSTSLKVAIEKPDHIYRWFLIQITCIGQTSESDTPNTIFCNKQCNYSKLDRIYTVKFAMTAILETLQ